MSNLPTVEQWYYSLYLSYSPIDSLIIVTYDIISLQNLFLDPVSAMGSCSIEESGKWVHIYSRNKPVSAIL